METMTRFYRKSRGCVNRRRGLTLLELILAMTILSFVVLACSYLSISGIRLTDAAMGDIRSQGEMAYVMRDIRDHLKGAKNPTLSCTTTEVPDCVFQAQDEDDVYIVYRYADTPPGTRLFSRGIKERTDPVVTEVLSSGLLLQRTEADNPVPLPFFRMVVANDQTSKNLVEINFAANRMLNGRVIALPEIRETIMLRGAERT